MPHSILDIQLICYPPVATLLCLIFSGVVPFTDLQILFVSFYSSPVFPIPRLSSFTIIPFFYSILKICSTQGSSCLIIVIFLHSFMNFIFIFSHMYNFARSICCVQLNVHSANGLFHTFRLLYSSFLPMFL